MKPKWSSQTTKDDAYEIGHKLGVRDAFEFLAEEGAIDSGIISWLLEKWFEKYDKQKSSPKKKRIY